MAKASFKRVALMARKRGHGIAKTLQAVITFLQQQHVNLVLDESTAGLLKNPSSLIVASEQLAKHCDLIIVIGGDGSLLNAAAVAIDQDLPILGINRGRLGFLTDIKPNKLDKISDILAGHYQQEQRFLLKAQVYHQEKLIAEAEALNEVVLLPGDINHMIEFDIHINQQFMCHQRADGLIIATPTGSTAYALSGGGPILHPSLQAMVLVPMHSHNLSSRPIVINYNSKIEIIIPKRVEQNPGVSCDGKPTITIPADGHIKIKKNGKSLRLIHPIDYHYYENLRAKLGWES